MKKIAKILGAMLLLIAIATPSTVQAQILKGGYFNVDWQFNIPMANEYANHGSGWRMSF